MGEQKVSKPDKKNLTANETLKPCPFCGSEKVGVYSVSASAEKICFRIVCKNVKTKSGWHYPHIEGPVAETKESAIAAWNKRHES